MSRLGAAGRLGSFFIESKLTPLLVLTALGLGAFAVVLTPREEEPQITVPLVDVFVQLPGASPEEVESRVAVPLERRMARIPGVEFVYSTSMPSVAMVSVRFFVGEDEQESLVKVFEELAAGLDRAPPGATPPLVKLRTIDDVPVLGLTLWSRRLDSFELRRLAAEVEAAVVQVDAVAETRLIGGQRRQVRVDLDALRLAAHGLDPAAVADAVQLHNAEAPSGSYAAAGREIRVSTGAFLTTAEEVAALVVGVHAGRPVYLRDVATVRDGPAELDDYVLFAAGPAAAAAGVDAHPDDEILPAVTLTVAKRKGADAARVVDAVRARVAELEGTLLPDDVEIAITRNYGRTASEKADELLVHLLGAIVSVTIVIGLALGWRGALVVFVAVPVTFALTLFVYYLYDYTLNRVTLFALIFVTGIVVDDSIIVVENIARHLSMRKLPPRQAAITAVDEVGNPTILATLTVIAAVLPMAFVSGLMGPYMSPMPVGAALAMVFSLLVAFIAAPWFAYRLLGRSATEDGAGYDLERTGTYRAYRAVMRPLLERPARRWTFLGAVVVLLGGAVAMFPLEWVTVKMLPFDNKSEVQIIIDTAEGTTLEATAHVAREIAAYLQGVPEVTDLQLYVGTAAPINFNGLVRHYDLRSGPAVADIQVNLLHKGERDDRSHDIARRIRPPIQAIAARLGAAVKVAEVPPGPPVLATLVAEVYGPDLRTRLAVARSVRDVFSSTPGVVDVDWLVEDAQPKQRLVVDREKAALHGVAPAQVVRAVRLALGGEDVGLVHLPAEAEPVTLRLRLPRAARSSVVDLERIRVRSLAGELVPVAEIVDVVETVEPVSRHRKNLRPVVYVTADVAGEQESPVYAILDMAERIDALELPHGGGIEQHFRAAPTRLEQPAVKWDGEWHITYEVFRDLGISFAVVLLLIYVLIIGWFESFTVPLVMMIAIPLSLVGVVPGHALFGAFFTATSMIGFIALAGIMVRNSVLLIDFVNLSLAEGKSLAEATVEAGAVRFRPILLTAGTVVVGAFVILFDPIFEGLAIALMMGAVASTVLTLVVVPLVHFMIGRRIGKGEEESA